MSTRDSAEISELLELARHAARFAAAVHRRAIGAGRLHVDTKRSSSDLVTEVDREAERELVTAIRAARPHDGIIGEEGTNVSSSTGVNWILDPLDGTTNFVHGYPAHSVAVGVEMEGRRLLGVVHDTSSNRVYAGVVGEGATCDGKPLAVRNESLLSQALVGTGFLPDADVRRQQAELLKQILPRVRDVRRSGCPSLDICGVASGALDAFYECGLGRWDIVAAAAIAEAAGAEVLLLNSLVFRNPFLVVAGSKLVRKCFSCWLKRGWLRRRKSVSTTRDNGWVPPQLYVCRICMQICRTETQADAALQSREGSGQNGTGAHLGNRHLIADLTLNTTREA
jgi:myo-inositol-1(or 4)-monophosphatase